MKTMTSDLPQYKTSDEVDFVIVATTHNVLAEIALHAIFRQPADTAEAPPDAGDAHLWALLAACPGAVLVTGDSALLQSPPPDASSLSPREFANAMDLE